MECGIALGSNSGDRMASLRAAVEALCRQDADLEVSPVYETAPVDCPEGSEPFLNAAAILHWSGTPEELLDFLRGIESQLGRPAERARNAPRSIDLDILYAGETMQNSERLTLPHPRLHLRRFVLLPLSCLRPHLRLPGFQLTIQDLLANLPDEPSLPRRVEDGLR